MSTSNNVNELDANVANLLFMLCRIFCSGKYDSLPTILKSPVFFHSRGRNYNLRSLLAFLISTINN